MLVRKWTVNSCSPSPPKSTDCKLDPGLPHPGNEGQTPGNNALCQCRAQPASLKVASALAVTAMEFTGFSALASTCSPRRCGIWLLRSSGQPFWENTTNGKWGLTEMKRSKLYSWNLLGPSCIPTHPPFLPKDKVIWSLRKCSYRPQKTWHPAMPQAVILTNSYYQGTKEMLRAQNA